MGLTDGIFQTPLLFLGTAVAAAAWTVSSYFERDDLCDSFLAEDETVGRRGGGRGGGGGASKRTLHHHHHHRSHSTKRRRHRTRHAHDQGHREEEGDDLGVHDNSTAYATGGKVHVEHKSRDFDLPAPSSSSPNSTGSLLLARERRNSSGTSIKWRDHSGGDLVSVCGEGGGGDYDRGTKRTSTGGGEEGTSTRGRSSTTSKGSRGRQRRRVRPPSPGEEEEDVTGGGVGSSLDIRCLSSSCGGGPHLEEKEGVRAGGARKQTFGDGHHNLSNNNNNNNSGSGGASGSNNGSTGSSVISPNWGFYVSITPEAQHFADSRSPPRTIASK